MVKLTYRQKDPMDRLDKKKDPKPRSEREVSL